MSVWKKNLNFLGAKWASLLHGWEYSWRDYPIQHASSMSPHNRAPVALHVLCVWVCVGVFVCVTAYSIIGAVGDGGSCGHKLTWNFLNKGLIFTGSCTVLEGVSLLSLIILPSRSHQRFSISTYLFSFMCVCWLLEWPWDEQEWKGQVSHTMWPKVCGHSHVTPRCDCSKSKSINNLR